MGPLWRIKYERVAGPDKQSAQGKDLSKPFKFAGLQAILEKAVGRDLPSEA